MTRKAILLGLAMVLVAGLSAGAAPVSSERTAVGADIGATAAGAFVGALAVSLSVELPLSRGWAINLEPSFYAATGTDTSILQINAEALARFYLTSLFVVDAARPVQWGPFVAAGAVAAWEYAQGDSAMSVLALGPAVRAGYRVVFGDTGFFFEPSLGFMALVSSRTNTGVTLGMTAGWRF